jgi:hypothetical protein
MKGRSEEKGKSEGRCEGWMGGGNEGNRMKGQVKENHIYNKQM